MDAEAPHRARSMAEMGRLQGRLLKPEDIASGMQSYQPRASDIIIAPAGKCGTTWLQQTFHCLRTRGDMDFDDISRVVPWIETAGGLGIDLNAPQRAEPRGYKSHLPYTLVPKGARYVVSFRDPRDALVSMHRFMEGWFIEPGSVPIGEFAQPWLKGDSPGGGYWSHLISWWEQRDNPDVLLLSYEHMTAEPEANVRRVAAFCGLGLDDELLALTLERSSLAYMLQYKDRFDDAMMRALSEQRCNLPPGSDSAKVRAGKVGSHKQDLPPDVAAAVDARWAETITPALGFADYASLEAELRRRSA
ncbi:MAG TPA: sulfotransferase domain-containing protein [Caulobacteraceae bacterium]|jgi:hypothetical protein|nr:sulfotransferase domain-containing protein [Caulobacteraceae bacterium]